MNVPSRTQYVSSSRGRLLRTLVIACAMGLAACSSPAEKANKFYEKGMELMQKGELDKARIEFRNALQIKDDMTPAWMGLAQIAEKKGNWEDLYGLLNKVVDHDPKNLDAQLKLGRLLLAAGQMDKAMAASEAALALDKNNASVLALHAAVLYKLDNKKGAVDEANAALAKDPNNIDALVVLATERLAAKDAGKAIEYLDLGLKQNEKNLALQLIKVQALESMANLDSAEAIFRKLISFYPDARPIRHILARFYLSHNRKDAAEAEYRAIAAEHPADVDAKLDVVRFVGGVKGPAAAIQELEGLIAKDAGNFKLQFALVGLHQAQNNQKAAEDLLRAIAGKAGDSQDGIKAKGMLAAMLMAKGDRQQAQALVKEVLAKDQRNEQGLLLKAGMDIADRNLDQAIADLRTILRDTPDSPRALLMLAQAHELSGSAELAQEHYLKAFQAGKFAPQFGLPYGQFLLKKGQAARAEEVAEDMLRASPNNVPAMTMLAQAKLSKGDFAGAQAVADDLRKQGDKGKVSGQITGTIQAARKNYGESIASFKQAVEAAPGDAQPMVGLVRTYLRAGKIDEALAFLNSVVRANPGNTNAQLLLGRLNAQKGDAAAAANAFKTVIGQQPKASVGYVNLASLYLRAGQPAEADKVIAQGLAAIPGDFSLRVTQAGAHELAHRYDDAIVIYEQLLKERPQSDVVANNLASLLSDYRSDKASLNRAYEIAQRFRRSEIPQFKDTLGWISYKLGKGDEAVSLIGEAAKLLPDQSVMHYHLGMSYIAVNNKDAAKKELEKALALNQGRNTAEAEQVKRALQGL
ncbi:MAG: tetratricopeptide repeat protein [Thiobacillus sp.]|nr:tetratricopeptide repeat protein [Thiobacillus sp.]